MIQIFVYLRAQAVNGFAAGPVQHPDLNGCLVRDFAHDAAQGVDLLYQMPFCGAAYVGITSHESYRFRRKRRQ